PQAARNQPQLAAAVFIDIAGAVVVVRQQSGGGVEEDRAVVGHPASLAKELPSTAGRFPFFTESPCQRKQFVNGAHRQRAVRGTGSAAKRFRPGVVDVHLFGTARRVPSYQVCTRAEGEHRAVRRGLGRSFIPPSSPCISVARAKRRNESKLERF